MTSSNVKMFKNYVSIPLALPHTTINEKGSLLYVIYLNLFKDHFWWRDLGVPTAQRENLSK